MREIPSPLLAERTTIRLGGRAIAELVLESQEDLEFFTQRLRNLGGTPLIIGGGSNLLAMDGELELVLLRPEIDPAPKIIAEENGRILVRAGASLSMRRLLAFCLRNGFSGLEALTGIPGTVGGAVAMNAGSFGQETGRLIQSLLVFCAGELHQVSGEQLRLGYRKLEIVGFSESFMIIEAIFGLTRSGSSGIAKAMRLNFFEKKSKQPIEAWSAGCAFKNPVAGEPAGKLLEQAGFKGKRKGGMAFSAKHANFLINEGHGSAQAALDLLLEAREEVARLFGTVLEPEIRLAPCPLAL